MHKISLAFFDRADRTVEEVVRFLECADRDSDRLKDRMTCLEDAADAVADVDPQNPRDCLAFNELEKLGVDGIGCVTVFRVEGAVFKSTYFLFERPASEAVQVLCAAINRFHAERHHCHKPLNPNELYSESVEPTCFTIQGPSDVW